MEKHALNFELNVHHGLGLEISLLNDILALELESTLENPELSTRSEKLELKDLVDYIANQGANLVKENCSL